MAPDLLYANDYSTSTANWTPQSGTWAGESNEYSGAASTSTLALTLYNAASYSDFVYETKVKPVITGTNYWRAALIFRYQDGSNYYFAHTYENGIYLYKKVAGVNTILGSAALTIDPNAFHNLKVEANGPVIRVYLNNQVKIKATDTTFTSGKLALSAWGDANPVHIHYDDARAVSKEIASYAYDYKGRRIGKNLPQAPLFSDDFSGTLSNWQLPSAGWVVEAGELSATTAADETMLSAKTFTDFTYSADITMKSGRDVGLFFRASDANNGYLFRASGQDGAFAKLYKRQAGAWTELASAPITAPSMDTKYNLKVTASGSSIRAYLNQTLIISAVNTTYSSGKIGIRSTNAGGTNHHHIDNAVVSSGPQTTFYHYDGNNVVAETDEANTITARYAYLPGDYKPYSMTKYDGGTPTTYYYHANTRGDVVAMVNQAGSIVAKYTYDPWGKILTIKDGSGVDVSSNPSHIANINPIRYAGYRYDQETGLYYLLARYYDPGSYRFLTKDPDGGDKDRPLSQNPYAYAEGNPVNRVDPDGELGIGIMITETTDAGIYRAGAGQTGVIGVGIFGGKGAPTRMDSFGSWGGLVYKQSKRGHGKNGKKNRIFGLFGGIGISIFYTNAKRAKQLKGRFTGGRANVGAGVKVVNYEHDVARNGTELRSGAIPPIPGVGLGAALSTYDTDTRVF